MVIFLSLISCYQQSFQNYLVFLGIILYNTALFYILVVFVIKSHQRDDHGTQVLSGEIKMYAVIKSGGKQHRVSVGETLKVELLKAEKGETLKIEEVLMVVDGAEIKIGSPVVTGASVEAEVVEHGRGKKKYASLSIVAVSTITKSKAIVNGLPS